MASTIDNRGQSWRRRASRTWSSRISFLCERFVPAYNRRFAVPAMEPGTAFVPWVGASLTDVLCAGGPRRRQRQHGTLSGAAVADPPDRHRFHDVQATVRVHAYPNGTLAVFHGLRCLARYQPDGRVIESTGALHVVAARPADRATDRSLILGQLCAKEFRRAAEMIQTEIPDRSCAPSTGQLNLLSTGERQH